MTNHPNRSKQQQPTHTPGLWHVCQNGIKEAIYAGDRLLLKASGETIGEIEANARLIAAAPELLAALKETLETLGDIADKLAHWSPIRNDLEAQCAAIRAAIAKAEGR